MVAVASCSNATDSTSSISYTEVRNWLQKTPELKGEKWFVVGAEWFSRFIGQFEELSDTQFSPKRCGKITPIDNSDLLDENQKIRRNLILDMHYRILPKEGWDRLVSEYKMKNGQNPIPVSIIQEGDALGPELYFYQVTLKKNKCQDKSERSYSRITTFCEIEEDMREFFKVSCGEFPEARLKLRPMPDCDWVPIEDKSVPLMDTGATDLCEIMIDVDTSSYWDDVVNDHSNDCYDAMAPSPSLHSSTVNEEHKSKVLPLICDAAPCQNVVDNFINDENGFFDTSVSSEPLSGDIYGPRTLQEAMEERACSDISNVGLMSTPSSTSIFKNDVATDDSYLNGVMNGSLPQGAIPLPYPGPLNPPEAGPIALPYGPLPQGSTNSNIQEPSEPGVCGLRNLGNSCYMNSALQCLSNIKPLCDYFRSDEWKNDVNTENKMGLKGDLATEYANLMYDMWSGKFKSLSPREMKRMVELKDKVFVGYRQHDSQELMSTVLDGLHEDLKRPPVKVENDSVENGLPENGVSENGDTGNGECDNELSLEERAEEAKREHQQREKSRIIDLFHGYQKSTVVCSKCLNKSERFENFNMLTLSLPGSNLCRLDITFVSTGNPQSQPVRHKIEVESTGTVLDLLKSTAEVTKSDVSRLWAAQICSYKVNQHLPSSLPISNVTELFQLYVFERPSVSHNGVHNGDEDEAMDECSMVDGEFIVNGNGEIKENNESATDIQPVVINMVDDRIHLPFGQPVVHFPSQVPSSMSVEQLTELVMSQGSRFIKRPSSANDTSTWWKDCPSKQSITSSIANTTTSSLPDLRDTSSAYEKEGETTGSVVSMDDSNGSEVEEGPPMFTLWEVDDQGNRHRLEPGAVVKIPGDKMIRLTAIWDQRAKNKFYDDGEANSVKYPSTSRLTSNMSRKTTLSECLDLLTSEERLDGLNLFECPKCPRMDGGQLARCPATKKIDLWELPPVLILHFKRFTYHTYTTKLEMEVQIPVTGLTLQPWLEGPQSTSVYDLVAVSNHSGKTLNYGHYTSLAKNYLDSKWYKFDDEDVTEVEPKIDGELAYILVYVRRETDNGTVNGEEDMEIA